MTRVLVDAGHDRLQTAPSRVRRDVGGRGPSLLVLAAVQVVSLGRLAVAVQVLDPSPASSNARISSMSWRRRASFKPSRATSIGETWPVDWLGVPARPKQTTTSRTLIRSVHGGAGAAELDGRTPSASSSRGSHRRRRADGVEL